MGMSSKALSFRQKDSLLLSEIVWAPRGYSLSMPVNIITYPIRIMRCAKVVILVRDKRPGNASVVEFSGSPREAGERLEDRNKWERLRGMTQEFVPILFLSS